MASRARQSTAEPTQRRTGPALPPYEKPTFPLNPATQRALEQLTHTHNLRKLDEGLAEAQTALSATAGEINDRLTQKEHAIKKRKSQRDQSGSAEAGEEDEIERNLEEFRGKVERMTQRMDESMRKMIDAQHSVQAVRDSVVSTFTDARADADTQATMQQARTQQYEDFQPTDPAAGTQDIAAPIELFRAKTEDAKLRYQSNSLTMRYAENNNYRDFRRVVHDARHPDGDVPLRHQSEWFEEEGAPAPGITSRPQGDENDDSDEDIAMTRTKTSTTCPLTLAEFKRPLTSKLCPHSFEADAILTLIRRSEARQGGPGSVHVHQCPVLGCSNMLAANDLYEDKVLVRQIRRLQASKEREQEEEDEDGAGRGGATVIEDGDDDAEDVDDIIQGRSTQVKKEPRTQRGTGNPRSTARGNRATPMNLDDDETDEDESMDE